LRRIPILMLRSSRVSAGSLMPASTLGQQVENACGFMLVPSPTLRMTMALDRVCPELSTLRMGSLSFMKLSASSISKAGS
jgi:hypothetical protein